MIIDEKIISSNSLETTGFIISSVYYDFRSKDFWGIDHNENSSTLSDSDLIGLLREELEDIEKPRQSVKHIESESEFITERTFQNRMIKSLQSEVSSRLETWRSLVDNFTWMESAGFSYNHHLD